MPRLCLNSDVADCLKSVLGPSADSTHQFYRFGDTTYPLPQGLPSSTEQKVVIFGLEG